MKIFRLFVAFTLICFALSPSAQAVVPAPDGGYPNFTTAEGDHALEAFTLGVVGNTAIGAYSLFSVTTGGYNTAVGASAGNGVATADGVTCIGANVGGANVSNTTWIASVYGVTTQSGTTAPVIVSDTGQNSKR